MNNNRLNDSKNNASTNIQGVTSHTIPGSSNMMRNNSNISDFFPNKTCGSNRSSIQSTQNQQCPNNMFNQMAATLIQQFGGNNPNFNISSLLNNPAFMSNMTQIFAQMSPQQLQQFTSAAAAGLSSGMAQPQRISPGSNSHQQGAFPNRLIPQGLTCDALLPNPPVIPTTITPNMPMKAQTNINSNTSNMNMLNMMNMPAMRQLYEYFTNMAQSMFTNKSGATGNMVHGGQFPLNQQNEFIGTGLIRNSNINMNSNGNPINNSNFHSDMAPYSRFNNNNNMGNRSISSGNNNSNNYNSNNNILRRNRY